MSDDIVDLLKKKDTLKAEKAAKEALQKAEHERWLAEESASFKRDMKQKYIRRNKAELKKNHPMYSLLGDKERMDSVTRAQEAYDKVAARDAAIRAGKPDKAFLDKLHQERLAAAQDLMGAEHEVRGIEWDSKVGPHRRVSDAEEYKSLLPRPVLKVLKSVGPIVTAASILSAPSADAAVGDLLGVEELGRDEEQKALDRRYQEILKERSGR
jgi:hypothetical protein